MWLSLFDMLILEVVALKILAVLVILYHLTSAPKKGKMAIAYASQAKRE
jgi:hypothetical protein